MQTTQGLRPRSREERGQDWPQWLCCSNLAEKVQVSIAYLGEEQSNLERTVIAEHSAEVTDDVNDEKDGSLLGPHCEIAAIPITLDRMRSSSLLEKFPDLAWAAENRACSISPEGECEQNDDDDDRVSVVRQERRLDTTEHGVNNDADWKEVASRCRRNASQGIHRRRTASQQHSRDEDVCHQPEDDVDAVGDWAIARSDDFQECVRIRSLSLQLDCERCEEDDLNGSSRSVPEGTANSVLVRNGR